MSTYELGLLKPCTVLGKAGRLEVQVVHVHVVGVIGLS